jgi:hypothetical protein
MTSIATLLGINSSNTEDNNNELTLNMPHDDTLIDSANLVVATDATNLVTEVKTTEVNEVKTTEVVDPNAHTHIEDNGSDDGNDVPNIGENENIPDIELKSVSELQSVLGDMKYEDLRKGLYKKYGLVTKDEPSTPGLYMITYNKPDKVSFKNKVELSKEQQDIISHYRGIIVEKDTNKPVCYTFDKMSRHFPDDMNLTNCKITTSCDGSQIKVFYYEKSDHWVVSTTRRIDASHSYFFSNKSFMEMFQDASSSLAWDKLDKKCCYSFVLAHPDNRVVARHNKPFLTHVLTRNMTTFEISLDDIGIPQATPVTFNTKSDMWKSIKRLPYYKEGYVVQNGNTFIKLINSKYQEVKDLRGSSSSLLFHYFHLKKLNKIKLFLSYFPESSETFKYFEGCFQNLCVLAFNEYILTRVRKVLQPTQVLRFLKPVIYKLHGIHLKTKVRVRLADVKVHLEEYPPFMLRKLVDMANGLPYSFV